MCGSTTLNEIWTEDKRAAAIQYCYVVMITYTSMGAISCLGSLSQGAMFASV